MQRQKRKNENVKENIMENNNTKIREGMEKAKKDMVSSMVVTWICIKKLEKNRVCDPALWSPRYTNCRCVWEKCIILNY